MHTATQSGSEGSSELLAAGEYLWARPNRFSAAWELKNGNESLISVSAPKSFGRMVYCTFDGKSYSIKKGGVRHPGAEVRLLSSERPVYTIKQLSVSTSSISGNDNEYLLKRKETSNEWILSSGDETIMEAVRDLSGKTPEGRITLIKETPRELIAASWFMIFTDEMP